VRLGEGCQPVQLSLSVRSSGDSQPDPNIDRRNGIQSSVDRNAAPTNNGIATITLHTWNTRANVNGVCHSDDHAAFVGAPDQRQRNSGGSNSAHHYAKKSHLNADTQGVRTVDDRHVHRRVGAAPAATTFERKSMSGIL
jgi:hypothetical protein